MEETIINNSKGLNDSLIDEFVKANKLSITDLSLYLRARGYFVMNEDSYINDLL